MVLRISFLNTVKLWQWIEEKLKEVTKQYRYEEIRTPIFEHTEIFQRGVGDTTDIVQKEMYTFQDRGGRRLNITTGRNSSGCSFLCGK